MNISDLFRRAIILFAVMCLCIKANSQNLDGFTWHGAFSPEASRVENAFQFNGYTKYWHDGRNKWITYGNLFKTAVPDVDYTIAQSKRDIADDMKIPGLSVQEGFISELFKSSYKLIDSPTTKELSEALAGSDVLVLADPGTETGKKLLESVPVNTLRNTNLRSHQLNAVDFTPVDAFYLEKGGRKVFVISSADRNLRKSVSDLISGTKTILEKYDLQRGWFGAETLLKSVTCTAGHPLEVIGRGMNEGNTWFTFSGYMDFLAQKELSAWLDMVGLPVVTDVGTYMDYTPSRYRQAIFGCDDYNGMQVQDMYTVESCIKYAHDRNGYVFRSVYDPYADLYHYDGYIASEGNKEQIDDGNVPFVTATGSLDNDAVPCMVLFTPKGEKLSRQLMWESIMSRHGVAVLGSGKMMGPAPLRYSLELLLLDRAFLDEYFGSSISLAATVDGYGLDVDISNALPHAVSGYLEIVLPSGLALKGPSVTRADLPAGASQTLHFDLEPSQGAMGRTNPVAIHYSWKTGRKSTLTMLNLPPVISANQLLYGHTPSVQYPVTVHNYTRESTFPVKVEVFQTGNPQKIIYSDSKNCTAPRGTFSELQFNLEVPAGSYSVRVSALEDEIVTQLGAGKAEGAPVLYATDLNGDGVNEYVMENDSVKVTLLATGGRLIEYLIKSRNDNALYKIWPVKPVDDKRPFRKRGYYPYGGFEDFLGQASMETHKLYDARIIKDKGDYVQVKMTADYFGNKLEKTYTLYGNSPLVEVRFALTFSNPEANVIAPVPVLELGARHWTEDVFTVPSKDGLQEYRMKPERYYGKIFFLREGWDAGYDTKEDIGFVSAFPVEPPLFLHMFMNHPRNPDAHFYCHEFQPWVPILPATTTYFTFYMWGAGGKWQNSLQELRDRNLISVKKE